MRATARVARADMRRRHLGMVLEQLHVDGPRTRSALTMATGLSRSTVGTLVSDLVERGLAVESSAPAEPRQPGRPSPLVAPTSDRVVAVAVDIAVASVAVATLGLGGTIHAYERLVRDRDPDEPEVMLEELTPLLRGQLDALRDDQVLLGVGVAVAGVVRRSDGRVHVGPNLGWVEADLGELVMDAIADPAVPVRVANEADMGALAEWRHGAGGGVAHLAYVFAEVGVGGGLIVDGRPLSGHAGYAGEVGHMPLNPAGFPCRCGSQGCWETEIAHDALERRAVACGLRPQAQALLDAAADGHTDAVAEVAEVARWIAAGLAVLVNVLNPQRIVLGGLLASVLGTARAAFDAAFARACLTGPGDAVEVVPAALDERAALVGAGELVLGRALDDPTIVPVTGSPAPALPPDVSAFDTASAAPRTTRPRDPNMDRRGASSG